MKCENTKPTWIYIIKAKIEKKISILTTAISKKPWHRHLACDHIEETGFLLLF